MGVHLFILYWAMLSFITPPVALGAIAAAVIAGSNPDAHRFRRHEARQRDLLHSLHLRDGYRLLLEGDWQELFCRLARASAGIWLIVAGLQGYMQGIGELTAWPVRLGFGLVGLGIAFSGLLFAD